MLKLILKNAIVATKVAQGKVFAVNACGIIFPIGKFPLVSLIIRKKLLMTGPLIISYQATGKDDSK